jgi:lysine-N-methylase
MRKLPERPRLAEHVVARRHLVDDRSAVVLHDPRTARAVQLGAREWELLAAADGTRDLDGIVLAAAREGAHARVEHLRAFLTQLHDAGFVDGGDQVEAGDLVASAAMQSADSSDAAERGLEVLPSFSLHCDGRGSCCRQYETVLFAPVEAARARSLCPGVLDAGAKHERAFLPERGSTPGGGLAVTLVNGACAYLDAAQSCRIHQAGGEAAKPLGCRLFPATFVDDGTSVRVSAAVECACVLASVGRVGGAPLIASSAKTRAALAPEVDVARLPDAVRLTATRTARRDELHAWSAEVARAPVPADAVAALLTLADDVENGGLATFTTAARSAETTRRHEVILRAHLRALHARVEKRARDGATWRSERDFARQAIGWMARAGAGMFGGALAGALAAPGDASREAFYVRASIFGHALVVDDVPLAEALRDRATRLVLARALSVLFAAAGEPIDAGLREPIAVVEAMLRGHGLGAYVHDVDA